MLKDWAVALERSRPLFVGVALAVLAYVPAVADPSPYGLRERHLVERGTPSIEIAGMRVFHSPGSEAQARAYGETVADAARWYRANTDWRGPLTMAVLDRKDWADLVTWPYPVPHAEITGSMVVMPRDIASFPGFDRWGLDGHQLNLALTLHELGHIIMREQDIRPANHWIDELVANVVMAAYVREAAPDLEFILEGPPAGFANPGPHDQLVDLDNFYSGGGLENYAWFQFRLAVLADHLARSRPVAALIEELAAAFPEPPPGIRDAVFATLAKLDAIAPGSSALVADMAGDGAAPRIATVSCGALDKAAPADGPMTILHVENRGTEPVRHRIPEKVAYEAGFDVRMEQFNNDIDDAELKQLVDAAVTEALASADSYGAVAQGSVETVSYKTGALMEVGDRCLLLPERPSMLILPE